MDAKTVSKKVLKNNLDKLIQMRELHIFQVYKDSKDSESNFRMYPEG